MQYKTWILSAYLTLRIFNLNFQQHTNFICDATTWSKPFSEKMLDVTVVNFEGEIPQEVTIEDKNTVEQMQLIQQLDEEDKSMIFRMVDTMLTKKKFKDFFQKNIATL